MTELLSVIIPTYNPHAGRLKQTLLALQQQTLNLTKWELIIVDNNSTVPVKVDLAWHPNSRMVTEHNQGLTHARLKGFDTAKSNLLVLVDDDNILAEDYLQNALNIFEANPTLGAIGGKSLPLFEAAPPKWLPAFYGNLALRNLGDKNITGAWQNHYPEYAPIGAGMCLRKPAINTYMAKIKTGANVITDRTGNSLSSGGDNDLVLEVLKSGWEVGYFPALTLLHIIPKERMTVAYLARLAGQSNQSWVKLLDSHGINPWKKVGVWTLPIRKVKAWFTFKVWAGKANYIKWRGYCGMLSGLAEI